MPQKQSQVKELSGTSIHVRQHESCIITRIIKEIQLKVVEDTTSKSQM
jgi:hypothetical protein